MDKARVDVVSGSRNSMTMMIVIVLVMVRQEMVVLVAWVALGGRVSFLIARATFTWRGHGPWKGHNAANDSHGCYWIDNKMNADFFRTMPFIFSG